MLKTVEKCAAKGTIPQLQADVLKAQLDKPVAIEIHTSMLL